jgi:hypothetical protein
MKTLKKNWSTLLGIFGSALAVVATALTVWSQTAPVLTVVPTGTNMLSITITNGISTGNYELWTTPILGDSVDYPWTVAAVGTNNQTSFTLPIGPYSAGFYRAVLDTNAIPLWETADPNNPAAGILTVVIDSPANGSVIQ